MTARARVAAVALAAVVVSSCAVGAGDGVARGPIRIPVCQIDRAMTLDLTFFATLREGRMLTIRMQNGGGPAEFSDSLYVTIDDVDEVRRRIAASPSRDEDGRAFVTLPVGLPGVAGVLVHAEFVPSFSCGRTRASRLGQNVGLRSVGGTITLRSVPPSPFAEATAGATAGDDLTDAPEFWFTLEDPRPIGSPAPHRLDPSSPTGTGQLAGSFRFHLSRAVPAMQFFP